jgi:adenylyltransferase/sulfurtransferase
VFGVLPGLVGTIQATEAIKLVLGLGDSLVGRLLLVDTVRMRFRSIEVRKDPDCPACGTRELQELIDYEAFCGLTGSDSEHDDGTGTVGTVLVTDLARRMRQGERVQLIDVREQHEWDIARIPGARLVPLGTLEKSLHTLDRTREVVLYCKTGIRSRRAAKLLLKHGFPRPVNVTGGIAAWSAEVDPAVPRY